MNIKIVPVNRQHQKMIQFIICVNKSRRAQNEKITQHIAAVCPRVFAGKAFIEIIKDKTIRIRQTLN